MTLSRLLIAWIVYALIIGSVLGGSLAAAWVEPPRAQVQQQASGSEQYGASEHSKENAEQALARYTLWLTGVTGILALATIGLGIATIGLYITGEKQIAVAAGAAQSASKQVALNRIALTDTNRAFVFISKTHCMAGIKKSTGAVIDWTFFTIFENSGNTPTRFMRMHTSWCWFKPGMPADFDFADMSAIAADDRPPMSLGPKGTTWSGESVIPLEILEQARKRELEVFLYRWVEYDDIFEGTPRHRTEYCTRIMVEGDPTIHMADGNTPHVPFLYHGHKKHNGADEECMRPLQTGSPKNP